MSITSRERMLLHWIIKRYDHAAGVDRHHARPIWRWRPGVSPPEFAEVVDSLAARGLPAGSHPDRSDGTWRLVPSDRGVLTAMGLAD